MYKLDQAKVREYATQNNWILPLRGEVYYPDSPRRLAVHEQIQQGKLHEKPPVFDWMNEVHWKSYFDAQTPTQLRAHLRILGIHPGKNKSALVGRLCSYYRALVNA